MEAHVVDGKKNEANGFRACISNAGFRDLLMNYQNTDVQKDTMKAFFVQYDITFDNDQQLEGVLDQIAKIKWGELKTLEDRLYGHELDVLTG
jgi:hypothetical protein